MRYILGFLATILLIVLLIVLLFHHGGSGKVPVTKAPLTSYSATGTVVRETTDGPINAPQDHREVRITVGRDNTTYEQIRGYDNEVIDSRTYPMSESAYAIFLHALQHAGYTLGKDAGTLKDERGYCPTGDRYIFEVIGEDGNDLERYWITSCGNGTPHTFTGQASLILNLFRAQVPGYDDLTNGIENL